MPGSTILGGATCRVLLGSAAEKVQSGRHRNGCQARAGEKSSSSWSGKKSEAEGAIEMHVGWKDLWGIEGGSWWRVTSESVEADDPDMISFTGPRLISSFAIYSWKECLTCLACGSHLSMDRSSSKEDQRYSLAGLRVIWYLSWSVRSS
jgi:hypothetical protein